MTRVFSILALAAPSLFVFAPAVSADALEDRYMQAQVLFEQRLRDFYVSRVPEMADKMPVMMENPRAVEAIRCGFNHVRSEGGDAGAEELVTWMEEVSSTPIESFEDLSAAPEGMVGDLMLEASDVCDSIAITMEIMEESGFLEMFSDPAVMERLIGDG